MNLSIIVIGTTEGVVSDVGMKIAENVGMTILKMFL
jgi:hypothetical protein